MFGILFSESVFAYKYLGTKLIFCLMQQSCHQLHFQPSTCYSRVQELLDLAEAQNFGFSGLADIKYDIVAIDPYDGNFVVSDLR